MYIWCRAGAHSAKVNRAHCPAQRLRSPGCPRRSPYLLPAPTSIRPPQLSQVLSRKAPIYSTARCTTRLLTASLQGHRKCAPHTRTRSCPVCMRSMPVQASMPSLRIRCHRASARCSICRVLQNTGTSSEGTSSSRASLCTTRE